MALGPIRVEGLRAYIQGCHAPCNRQIIILFGEFSSRVSLRNEAVVLLLPRRGDGCRSYDCEEFMIESLWLEHVSDSNRDSLLSDRVLCARVEKPI